MSAGKVCYLFAFSCYPFALEIIVEFPSAYQYFMKRCFSSARSGAGVISTGALINKQAEGRHETEFHPALASSQPKISATEF